MHLHWKHFYWLFKLFVWSRDPLKWISTKRQFLCLKENNKKNICWNREWIRMHWRHKLLAATSMMFDVYIFFIVIFFFYFHVSIKSRLFSCLLVNAIRFMPLLSYPNLFIFHRNFSIPAFFYLNKKKNQHDEPRSFFFLRCRVYEEAEPTTDLEDR